MKTFSKSLVVASIVGMVGAGGVATATVVGAESGTNASTDPMSSLVDKIASTFNIDKSKLQTLFDEDREAREVEREKQQSERLQSLVDDGTITSAQKTAIEAKIAEMKKGREANKDDFMNLSEDERKAKMEEKRTELEAWAKEQGLDLTKLRGVLGGHGGPGGPRM